MTIDECIEAYDKLASEIFSSSKLNKVDVFTDTGARYSAEKLEAAVKAIVGKYAKDPEAPMLDPNSKGPKVFVFLSILNCDCIH